MRFIIFIFTIMLCSCNPTKNYNERKNSEYMIYKDYCFEKIDKCTGNILIRILSNGNSSKVEKIVERIQIKPISPRVSSSKVIQQFLLSLECFNYQSKSDIPKIDLSLSLFFKNGNFNDEYIYQLSNKDYIKVTHLDEFRHFDFKHMVSDSLIDQNTVEISFGKNNGTILQCNKEYFDEILFPRYLNFVSVHHRITPYQLGISKVRLN